jgi:hypothetical protein
MLNFLSSMRPLRSATILSKEETVSSVKGNSLIRFGDGETIIISGGSIHYQSADNNLADELFKCVQEYIGIQRMGGGINVNNGSAYNAIGYMVCMPKEFLESSPFEMISNISSCKYWVGFRRFFKTNWDEKIVYGNSFVFAKGNEHSYKNLWVEKKHIIFIHNNEIYAKRFADKYGINTTFVCIPSKNAYGCIDSTFSEVTELVKNSIYDADDIAVLISAGPTGKALAVRLSQRGIQAIDTGHCWDAPLNA